MALLRIAYWTIVVSVFLLSAEGMARLDDWVRYQTPLLATPDHDRDLMVRDAEGVRGRPNGRFKKWQLNQFGFRGPPMCFDPVPGRKRIMFLGASETFGLYESRGKEFPAQVADRLEQEGRYEVVNAAVPGMTLKRILPYWETWGSQFHPDIVVIYPTPMFYLDDLPPALLPTRKEGKTEETGFSPRIVGRVGDLYFSLPRFVRRWREDWIIAADTAGKGEGWYFRSVPQDRLDLFVHDLADLTESIQARGAEPVLLTHALGAESPPRPEDLDGLHSERRFLPRPTPEVLAAFDYRAAEAVREFGRQRGLIVIDGAGAMNGKQEWFAPDLVHFNDTGASVVAGMVADRLRDD